MDTSSLCYFGVWLYKVSGTESSVRADHDQHRPFFPLSVTYFQHQVNKPGARSLTQCTWISASMQTRSDLDRTSSSDSSVFKYPHCESGASESHWSQTCTDPGDKTCTWNLESGRHLIQAIRRTSGETCSFVFAGLLSQAGLDKSRVMADTNTVILV